MMSSHNVLQLTSEHAVADARDRNPLTALPGNASIRRYLSRSGVGAPHTAIFFNFDNFKAFNDAHGFAEGDRVILHFADVLQAAGPEHGGFVSRVGGDDFFACFPLEEAAANLVTRRLLKAFRLRAEAHYTPEHRSASVEGLHRISLDALLAARGAKVGDWPATNRQSPRSAFLAETRAPSFVPAQALARAGH